MKSIVTIATAIAIGTAATTAGANGVTWAANSSGYSTPFGGTRPSVALSWCLSPQPFGSPKPPYGSQSCQMEVEQGVSPNLWDHVAAPYTQLVNLHYIGNGYNPTIASDRGWLSNFVEVYQSDDTQNAQLIYGIGTNGTDFTVVDRIGQGGFNPYVTVGDRSLIAEVHQGQPGPGLLWIDFAYPINTPGPGGWTHWSGISGSWFAGPYNNGAFPTVALAPINTSLAGVMQYLVLEVHQAGNGDSALWSGAGVLTIGQPNDPVLSRWWRIDWSSFAQFGYGEYASVAICAQANGTATVLEVHDDGGGALLSETGVFTYGGGQTPSFSWDPTSAKHYGNGYNPRVSCVAAPLGGPDQGLEVHQDGPQRGPLSYRAFSAN